MTANECSWCGKREAVTYDGFCARCDRKGSVLFSRNADDETYCCSLCIIAGRRTELEASAAARNAHLDEEHGVDRHDTEAIIREAERLRAKADRDTEQEGIGAYA